MQKGKQLTIFIYHLLKYTVKQKRGPPALKNYQNTPSFGQFWGRGSMAYNRNIPRKSCTNKVQKCLPSWFVMQTLHANVPCGVSKFTRWGYQNKDANKYAHNVQCIANYFFLLWPKLTAEGWRPFAKQRHKIPWKIILTWPLQHGQCILWAHPWPNPPFPR